MRRISLAWRLPVVAVAAFLLTGAAAAQSAAPPNVAAASNLQGVLPEIADAFRRESGHTVSLTFGSSGNFVRQILQGAPFALFLSADAALVDHLADRGVTVDRGVVYAVGRIVLFAPSGSPLRVDADFAGLKAALTDGRLRRFAIANPEHAPYGRAAEQVLRRHGLWKDLRPLLVLGENVSQAAQFAASGAAQGGILPLSLAVTPSVQSRGTYILLPADWHDPIVQKMVLLQDAGPVAQAFFRYLREASAREAFGRFGFAPPREN